MNHGLCRSCGAPQAGEVCAYCGVRDPGPQGQAELEVPLDALAHQELAQARAEWLALLNEHGPVRLASARAQKHGLELQVAEQEFRALFVKLGFGAAWDEATRSSAAEAERRRRQEFLRFAATQGSKLEEP